MVSTVGEDRRLVSSLMLLAAVTGLVDAASVLGLGRVFTGNMTGNVLHGFAIGGAHEVSNKASVIALAGDSGPHVGAHRDRRRLLARGGTNLHLARRVGAVLAMLSGAVAGAFSMRLGLALTIGTAVVIHAMAVARLSRARVAREAA